MIILAIRTDNPEAEIYLYSNVECLASIKWQAHRQLAETIHHKIKELLKPSTTPRPGHSRQYLLSDIDGIVCFKGPGSFTGLRIGLSVANALAYALDIPVVAKSEKNWLESGIKDLLAGKNDYVATPTYDRPAAVSKPL